MIQPNIWSCLPTAFMIATGEIDLIKLIGHDGSSIMFPEEHIPQRGFNVHEIIWALWHRGYAITEFTNEKYDREDVVTQTTIMEKFDKVKQDCNCVCVYCTPTGTFHAVAWDKDLRLFVDPKNNSFCDTIESPFDVFWGVTCKRADIGLKDSERFR